MNEIRQETRWRHVCWYIAAFVAWYVLRQREQNDEVKRPAAPAAPAAPTAPTQRLDAYYLLRARMSAATERMYDLHVLEPIILIVPLDEWCQVVASLVAPSHHLVGQMFDDSTNALLPAGALTLLSALTNPYDGQLCYVSSAAGAVRITIPPPRRAA